MTGINQQPSETAATRPGVGEYLLSMSPQIRAPLNAVIGMSGLLLDDELSDKQRQYVKTMHTAGESLSSMLNDVLDLARISAGRLVLEPIPFDLKSMIEETASVLSPLANERGLALRVDLRPELPRQVIGDPGRTRQVLGNLIGHAVNSTGYGEVVIRVLADSERDGVPSVRFVVEDTGVTLTPDRLGSLFDSYVPFDASSFRSFGVTGLGLRISDELVRLMGGEIGAEPNDEQGNRYWFTLPMPIPSAGAAATLEVSQAVRGGRALVVEADTASRTRFTDQIESAGWDVDFSSDTDSVVPMLREGAAIGNPFQAVIFSHYAVRPVHAELATRLKADQRLRSVALVMVTAVGSPGEAKKLWHAGFAGYLRKPVPSEEIQEALRALERVGADGRGPAMITRHLLAEVRNAQTFAVAGIDEMLATLTAAPTRRALVLGGDPFDQVSLKTATAAHGLEVEVAPGPNFEIDKVAASGYEIVVLDTRFLNDPTATVAMIRERLGRGSVPIVALTRDESSRLLLVAQGIDDVLTAPVQETDAAAMIAKWTGTPAAMEPAIEVAEPPAAIEVAEPPAAIEVVVSGEEPVPVAEPVAEVMELPAALEVEVSVEEPVAVLEPPAEIVAEAEDRLVAEPEVVELEVTPVEGLDQSPWEAEAAAIVVPAEDPVVAEPTVEPPSTEAVLGPMIIDQLSHGGGFFTQHLVGSFLRETSSRIAGLATASTRGDRARMEEALQGIHRAGDSIGAARLSDVAGRALRRVEADRLEEAGAMLGMIEGIFHETRQALDAACPAGLPAEMPAVGSAFLDQIAPEREGPARMLADRLVTSFGTDAPSRIQELREAVERGDAESAQRMAQTLKGMCGLVGAEPLAKLAALVEADARLKRVGQAGRYLEHLDTELARVQAVLKR